MSKLDTKNIQKLREATGAPVIRVKKVLEEVGGEKEKALEILKKEGFEKAAKRVGRETGQGVVKAYVHHNGKVACLVELLCETDFVAKNEIFQSLANDIALQVASMGEDELEEQGFIKDPKRKIGDLVKEAIAKTGENIRIGRTIRIELGSK